MGYGGAGTPTCFETTPVAALDNLTAAVRKGNGCIDTDNNANDFITIGPIPRNSSRPPNICGGNPALPSGVGTATPPSLEATATTLLTVTVTPATSPASTGITVTGDLTSIGGNASQQFYDDGTNGDVTAGDNVFSFRVAGARRHRRPLHSRHHHGRAGPHRPAPITFTVQAPPAAWSAGPSRWAPIPMPASST